ncbi:hypothetical protein N180_19075 [Pedobacter antarcticus 4BY]|uniref:Uncharacterized protein n=2 Tax=Pedobacter antarcticus TaxID=34086 RepID=A0A081PJ54_9SPHI|nr:hypothetical protein N180_19075 [Pedobacter antarcticus 4BY]
MHSLNKFIIKFIALAFMQNRKAQNIYTQFMHIGRNPIALLLMIFFVISSCPVKQSINAYLGKPDIPALPGKAKAGTLKTGIYLNNVAVCQISTDIKSGSLQIDQQTSTLKASVLFLTSLLLAVNCLWLTLIKPAIKSTGDKELRSACPIYLRNCLFLI